MLPRFKWPVLRISELFALDSRACGSQSISPDLYYPSFFFFPQTPSYHGSFNTSSEIYSSTVYSVFNRVQLTGRYLLDCNYNEKNLTPAHDIAKANDTLSIISKLFLSVIPRMSCLFESMYRLPVSKHIPLSVVCPVMYVVYMIVISKCSTHPGISYISNAY